MPEPITLPEVAALAARLPPSDLKQLAETILQRLSTEAEPGVPRRRSWREIRGSVPYLLYAEDAQAWVSRIRREAERQQTYPARGSLQTRTDP